MKLLTAVLLTISGNVYAGSYGWTNFGKIKGFHLDTQTATLEIEGHNGTCSKNPNTGGTFVNVDLSRPHAKELLSFLLSAEIRGTPIKALCQTNGFAWSFSTIQ